MAKGTIILVTGTDTGVGKTFVTAGLARGFTASGKRVAVCKPAETGCRRDAEGTLVPADGVMLREAAGCLQPLGEVVPYRFERPLAPCVAARLEGRPVSPHVLVEHITKLRISYDVVLVEGAGGLLVPLAEGFTFADLAAKLHAGVLIVAASKLGAINHTLLTMEVLAARRIEIAGYVLNEVLAPTLVNDPVHSDALATNRRTIAREAARYHAHELGVLPFSAEPPSLHDVCEKLAHRDGGFVGKDCLVIDDSSL